MESFEWVGSKPAALRRVGLVVLGAAALAASLVLGAAQAAPPSIHGQGNSPGAASDGLAGTSALSPTIWLPIIARDACPPGIEFTYVPPYGSFDNLRGRVTCVQPAKHKIAVYIYVSGWWNKPTWAAPLTPIQPDGAWVCDTTTGGADQNATKIAAFLVPNGYNPPLMSGGQTLPAELEQNSVARVMIEREPVYRTLQFSGYTWRVKASDTRVGPGPNYFSDRPEDVWVDAQGRLHLKIVYRNGRWYCSEVINTAALGYGIYTFTLASRVDQLDRNMVLGLFTWDDTAPEHNYREMDIEFARWGVADGDNAQYVVQPYQHAGNLHRFKMVLQGDYSTHSFAWRPDSVAFSSFQGRASPPAPGDRIETWPYTGADIPPPGQENARINFWLFRGSPPANGQGAEVIVEAFRFTSLGTPSAGRDQAAREVAATSLQYFHTAGRDIVSDTTGEKFVFRGVNLNGLEFGAFFDNPYPGVEGT